MLPELVHGLAGRKHKFRPLGHLGGVVRGVGLGTYKTLICIRRNIHASTEISMQEHCRICLSISVHRVLVPLSAPWNGTWRHDQNIGSVITHVSIQI